MRKTKTRGFFVSHLAENDRAAPEMRKFADPVELPVNDRRKRIQKGKPLKKPGSIRSGLKIVEGMKATVTDGKIGDSCLQLTWKKWIQIAKTGHPMRQNT